MSTNYDAEIAQMELKYRLEGQKNSLTRVELECLRLKKKIESYDDTRISLLHEIAETEQQLVDLKGGEIKHG